MTGFIGKYQAKVDDKGRIVLPAAFKSLLPSGGDTRLVVKKDIFEDCLEVLPYDEWQRESEQTRSRLDKFNKDHAKFWREYMRNRDVVEPDSKLGRILISKELLKSIGIDKDVVFYGSDYKIEIWAKEKFENSEISNEEFIALAGKLPEVK